MTTKNRPKPVAKSTDTGEGPRAAPVMMSLDEILAAASREYILIAGGDGTGKTSTCIALAKKLEIENPGVRVFVIDTENGWAKILRGYRNPPRNLHYYLCGSMEAVLEAFDRIRHGTIGDPEVAQRYQHAPIASGDWFITESMSRCWEFSQDLGYQRVSGQKKREYLGRDQDGKKKTSTVTPQPDQLWSVTKAAHDARFLDVLTVEWSEVNVLLTTTIAKKRDPGGFMRENKDRTQIRAELGIEAGFEGAPRLPYYPDCLVLLEKSGGRVSATVLKDRGSRSGQVTFPVDDPGQFPFRFFEMYRGGQTDEVFAAYYEAMQELMS